MRKIFFASIVVIAIMVVTILAVALNFSEIPDPPHYGMWLLRDGKMYEIPPLFCTQVGEYRGISPNVKEQEVKLQDGDRIFYFFLSPPGNLFTTPLDIVLTNTGGDPRRGGTYAVNLYLPAKHQDKYILTPTQIRPVKVINNVIMHEVIFSFCGVDVLHGGILTSNFISPSSSPVYLFSYHREFTKEEWSELMKRFKRKK